MLRSLWPAVLVLGAVEAAVIGHGEEGRIEAVASEAEAVAMPLVEVFRETSPSALLQKLQADPKLDKDLPVVHVGPTSDQDIDNMVKKERDAAWMSVGIIAASICVYIGLIVLLGWCYTKLWSTPVMPEFKAPADVEVEDFRYGVFSCLEDMHICALSCCCMPYRWADTLQAAGIMSFSNHEFLVRRSTFLRYLPHSLVGAGLWTYLGTSGLAVCYTGLHVLQTTIA